MRKQVAAFRARKKEENNKQNIDNTPRKLNFSASALRKATARARRNLPSTPRKKETAIRRLYFSDVKKNEISPCISETSCICFYDRFKVGISFRRFGRMFFKKFSGLKDGKLP